MYGDANEWNQWPGDSQSPSGSPSAPPLVNADGGGNDALMAQLGQMAQEHAPSKAADGHSTPAGSILGGMRGVGDPGGSMLKGMGSSGGGGGGGGNMMSGLMSLIPFLLA